MQRVLNTTTANAGITGTGTGMLHGWEWDHTLEKYVFGYKVHIAIDSLSGLPIMLTVTKAGFGENRTVRWCLSRCYSKYRFA